MLALTLRLANGVVASLALDRSGTAAKERVLVVGDQSRAEFEADMVEKHSISARVLRLQKVRRHRLMFVGWSSCFVCEVCLAWSAAGGAAGPTAGRHMCCAPTNACMLNVPHARMCVGLDNAQAVEKQPPSRQLWVQPATSC